MPADLPISPEKEDDDFGNEVAKWMTEFQIRSGEFNDADRQEFYVLAEEFLEGPVPENWDLVDEASTTFISMKQNEPIMHRLPVLHVTRENLSEVKRRGGLPQGFTEEFNRVVAGYINGFIPDQDIEAPENIEFIEEPDADHAGGHTFREDRVNMTSTFGSPFDGYPAATISAHETMHKNNNEALLEDPDEVRKHAWIYEQDLPEEYRDFVKSLSVAPVKENFLGALALYELDNRTSVGILAGYRENNREDINLHKYAEDFKTLAKNIQDELDLAYFDVRDEAICQSVTFFMNGYFEEDFEEKAAEKREFYNDNDDYSYRAGDSIEAHLRNIKKDYESAKGTRGQRFRQIMANRVPFLKNDYSYGISKNA